MQSGDREEFTKTLKILCAARGIPWTDDRDEAFWKGLAKMSLVQFNRAVDAMCEDHDPPRNLTPGHVWQAFKGQRAAGAPIQGAFPVANGWSGDKWDELANFRLMSIVLTACKNSRVISRDETLVLVAAKNDWARLMRACGEPIDVPLEEQNESWKTRIAQAKQEIAMLPQKAAA